MTLTIDLHLYCILKFLIFLYVFYTVALYTSVMLSTLMALFIGEKNTKTASFNFFILFFFLKNIIIEQLKR